MADTGRATSGLRPIGIVRNLDELSRIVIPKELRRALGIEAGTLRAIARLLLSSEILTARPLLGGSGRMKIQGVWSHE